MKTKLKTIIITCKTEDFTKCKEWDKEHRFPETHIMTERCAPKLWEPYNETYHDKDSFAKYCHDHHDDCPPLYMLSDNMTWLSLLDSIVDRFVNDVHTQKGLPIDVIIKEENEAKRIFMRHFDKIKNVNDVQIFKIKDKREDRVTTFTLVGSSDFFDLHKSVKKEMGKKWYKRFYDENKKRGLIDFPFKF